MDLLAIAGLVIFSFFLFVGFVDESNKKIFSSLLGLLICFIVIIYAFKYQEFSIIEEPEFIANQFEIVNEKIKFYKPMRIKKIRKNYNFMLTRDSKTYEIYPLEENK